jgi:hypothetical protein
LASADDGVPIIKLRIARMMGRIFISPFDRHRNGSTREFVGRSPILTCTHRLLLSVIRGRKELTQERSTDNR